MTFGTTLVVPAELQTGNVAYLQRKIQLSGFSAYPDGSPSQLICISGVVLYFIIIIVEFLIISHHHSQWFIASSANTQSSRHVHKVKLNNTIIVTGQWFPRME